MVRASALFASIAVARGIVIGYWDKTWAPSGAPGGANLGVAFNGWADPAAALADSVSVKSSLVGTKYISIGGGNNNGAFTLARVQDLKTSILAGNFDGWEGIALDVEECHDTGLGSAFQAVTAAAKSRGLQTMVTVSHSQPYGCDDAAALMTAFFEDENVDYMSPQLYTSGAEARPDFTAVGTTWNQYGNCKAALIPSIVDGTHYDEVTEHFNSLGMQLQGYVQWASAGITPTPTPTPSPSPSDCGCNSPDNCFVSNWAVPCFQATDANTCASYGGNFCGSTATMV